MTRRVLSGWNLSSLLTVNTDWNSRPVILDLRLQKLTGLIQKPFDEYKELLTDCRAAAHSGQR